MFPQHTTASGESILIKVNLTGVRPQRFRALARAASTAASVKLVG